MEVEPISSVGHTAAPHPAPAAAVPEGSRGRRCLSLGAASATSELRLRVP